MKIIGNFYLAKSKDYFNDNNTLLILFIFLFMLVSCRTNKIQVNVIEMKFDSEYWKSIVFNREEVILKNSDRQKMLNDLIQNILPNRTKEEVIQLLGDPDYNKMQIIENHLIYTIGMERNNYFAIMDSEWLIVYFDVFGRVDRTKIAID